MIVLKMWGSGVLTMHVEDYTPISTTHAPGVPEKGLVDRELPESTIMTRGKMQEFLGFCIGSA